MENLVASSFNFLLLVFLLFYKLKAPTKNYVAQRHVSIRDELLSVREKLRIAQEKYDEFSSKLKAIDAEIANMREQSKQEANAIKQRLVSDSRRHASLVISDARNAASGLFSDLKGQLYSELSSRVLNRAETILKERLTGDDRARIRQEFSRQVESIQ